MTFRIERVRFASGDVDAWAAGHERHQNWPVVYLIDGARPRTKAQPPLYVGETTGTHKRMRQHLQSPKKDLGFESVRVVIDETYNTSVCRDLESHLIRWFHGDGRYSIINGNSGLTDAQYFERELYRESFRDVFEELRAVGLFSRTILEIENDDLFKLSPFKALSADQAIAVEDIVDGLLDDLKQQQLRSTLVVQGAPGTGKTIVAIFLMKLLADIRHFQGPDDVDPDSMFAEFFTPENRALLSDFRMALVIPQQSLRKSVQKVFSKTPRLEAKMVLTPFEVGVAPEPYDLLLVDESHRLNQRANQPSAAQNKKFGEINFNLFGDDDQSHTQLDWIKAQSRHQILLVDGEQSVRPHDLAPGTLAAEISSAKNAHRYYPLLSQMRVQAGADYVEFIRSSLRGEQPDRPDLGDYDLQFFDDVGDMRRAIRQRDEEVGLSRMVAGYAWEWVSKPKGKSPEAFDIVIGTEQMRWNRSEKDWINSTSSLEEVGSVHTVQGYDLNYAGVIIGPDLRVDPVSGAILADRKSYRDKKGKERTGHLKRTFTDDDLLVFIRNAYGVLLTRGILGTYIYVCDPALRERLRIQFASSA